MLNQPEIFISIVTCFLNEERFLSEAVESVIAQSYTNWELILVDDGSSDNSTQICKEFLENYPGKIFYFEHSGHQNKGLSASRNLGISKAKGNWIALLDADDVWGIEKLAKQVQIIKQHPEAAMVCEASEYWSDWIDPTKTNAIVKIGNNLQGIYQPPVLLKLLYPLGTGNAPCPSAILFKRSVWQSVGGFQENFDGIYQLYEDQAFLCKVYLNEKVYISSDCNNKYRQRPGSLVYEITGSGNYHKVRYYFLEWFRNRLKSDDNKNKEIEDLLGLALASYHNSYKSKARKLVQKLFGLLRVSN